MQKIICGLVGLFMLSLTSVASAQVCESVCDEIEGETHHFEGVVDTFVMETLTAPPVSGDQQWRLTYCVEVWDDFGGFVRLEEYDGWVMPQIGGSLTCDLDPEAGGDQCGDDDYEAKCVSGPENPDGYPIYSDLNFYAFDSSSGDDYVDFYFEVTPFVTTYAIVSIAFVAE